MHNLYKTAWFLRYLFYIPWLGLTPIPSYIGRPCFLMGLSRLKLKRKTRIFPGSRIEIFPTGKVEFGENVAIAQNFHLTCKGNITIGEGTCIAANVCITDIKHRYSENTETNILGNEDLILPTKIGKNCFIGFGAVIDAGTTLGDGCIVGANAYVRGTYGNKSVIASERSKAVSVYE